eukprot:s7_g18.t1
MQRPKHCQAYTSQAPRHEKKTDLISLGLFQNTEIRFFIYIERSWCARVLGCRKKRVFRTRTSMRRQCSGWPPKRNRFRLYWLNQFFCVL